MRGVFVILFCTSVFFTEAQNMVLNYSFEDTIPSSVNPNCGGPEGAFPWFTPSLGTSDYFSMTYICSGFWGGGGYQVPVTGIAYCGFSLYDNYGLGNYREYIEGVLIDTMIANHTYCISFYASLANTSQLAVDRLGVYISVDSVYDHSTNQCLTTITPQIANPMGNIVSDTLNWVLISGNYTAQGGEKYITIGNFYNNAATSVDSVQGGIYKFAYYYVDDVSVIDCTVGINEMSTENLEPQIFPNPSNENFKIIYLLPQNKKGTLEIFDIEGRKVYKRNLPQWSTLQNISIPNLASGVYAVKINSDNFSVTKKLLVQQE